MTELKLTADQQRASTMFTEFLIDEDAKFMAIMGAAGTGKSTLVKHLMKAAKARMKLLAIVAGATEENPIDYKLEVTATTNKAAAVVADMLSRPCPTIHSRLALVPQTNYDTGEITFIKGSKYEPIYNTLLVIDEGSFMDDKLLQLIDESTVDCKILIIGDQYQLAPVEQTVPVLDKIKGYTACLEEIVRHGGVIAETGARFRETVKTGVFQPIVVNGKEIIHTDADTFKRMITEEFTHPDYCESKARVLAWQNDIVTGYNAYIRNLLGHPKQLGVGDVLYTNRPISTGKQTIHPTDSSVQITKVGDEAIQHGIAGRWVYLKKGYGYSFFLPDDPREAGAFIKGLRAQKRWAQFFQIQGQWLDLRPAFASTVHKSQGSTYDTVFINLSDIGRCRIPSDVARMMYVAITRAAKRVVLNGQLPFYYTGASNVTNIQHPVPA